VTQRFPGIRDPTEPELRPTIFGSYYIFTMSGGHLSEETRAKASAKKTDLAKEISTFSDPRQLSAFFRIPTNSMYRTRLHSSRRVETFSPLIPFKLGTRKEWLTWEVFLKTVEEERLHMKQRLAATFRIWALQSNDAMDLGVAGHASARDPEFTDCFWMNPFGIPFNAMTVGALVLVNYQGEVLSGTLPINAAGFAIHAGIYATNPRVKAVGHNHSVHGKAFSMLNKPLSAISQDACAFHGHQAQHDAFDGVVLDSEEGKQLGGLLGQTNHLVILKNHGFLTAGANVEEMTFWYVLAENCARAQLLAEAALGGPVKEIDDATARATWNTVGTPLAGIASYQPYYWGLIKRDPGFLSEKVVSSSNIVEAMASME
jgi:ribulose-5-phosphate 4-epimerase/fuculose-1-phosphate aldolase